MFRYKCSHGNSSSCPNDFLCQMRLGGERYGTWETHSVYACDANVDSWRRQIAPVLRKRNYEIRVVRLGDI
jgi:hypothetical protein